MVAQLRSLAGFLFCSLAICVAGQTYTVDDEGAYCPPSGTLNGYVSEAARQIARVLFCACFSQGELFERTVLPVFLVCRLRAARGPQGLHRPGLESDQQAGAITKK